MPVAWPDQKPHLQVVAAVGPQQRTVLGDQRSAGGTCEARDVVPPLLAGRRILALRVKIL